MKFLKRKNLIILVILTLILLFIPTIFWFDNLYYVGGDDTLLYYIYPKEMIKNYIFNIASDNVLSGIGSYSAQFYQLPFFLILSLLKYLFPFINTQTLTYGINLSLGFLFFYFFLGLWIKDKGLAFYVKIIGSSFYVFSIFSFYTLWQSLFTPYLVSVFPLTAYFFFKSLKTKKTIYVVLCSLVLTLMSITILLAPWFALGILALSPLLISEFLKNKILFIKHIGLLLLLLTLLNFYWLYHLVGPMLENHPKYTNELLDVGSEKFIQDARNNITEVTRLNNFVYPLLNLFHKDIQESGNWPNYPIFRNWYEKLSFFYFICLLIILTSGFLLKKAKKEFRKIYLLAGLGWLITLYFFSVRFGESIGLELFIYLNNNLPGFTMFRNVQGKIAPAFPFIYALLLSFSLIIVVNYLKIRKVTYLVLVFAAVTSILSAIPFIRGDFFKNKLWTTNNTYTTISGFNQDYVKLTEYLKGLRTYDRILWLPITTVNYVMIRDTSLPNHYYIGLSPIQFLSGKSDIAGIMSFPLDHQKRFINSFIDKDFEDIGRLFGELNISYFILNNDVSKDLQSSYLFGGSIDNLYDSQDGNFFKNIVGDKVATFGRYTIFKIHKKYKMDKIALKGIGHEDPSNGISLLNKISDSHYEIEIKNFKETKELIFHERFSPYWKVYTIKDRSYINLKHDIAYNYANKWTINKESIISQLDASEYKSNPDGSINFKLAIYFEKKGMLIAPIIISLTTLFVVIFLLIRSFLQKGLWKLIFTN